MDSENKDDRIKDLPGLRNETKEVENASTLIEKDINISKKAIEENGESLKEVFI